MARNWLIGATAAAALAVAVLAGFAMGSGGEPGYAVGIPEGLARFMATCQEEGAAATLPEFVDCANRRLSATADLPAGASPLPTDVMLRQARAACVSTGNGPPSAGFDHCIKTRVAAAIFRP